MKALVYRGPKQIAVEEWPIPEILPDDVLINVRASGICGSDIHGYLGGTGRRYPDTVWDMSSAAKSR